MKTRLSKHPILATLCILGLLLVAFFLVATYSDETVGPTPTLLYRHVPLDEAVSVQEISWSPSGAFILIETEDRSRSGYPPVGPVVVLDLANRSVAARIEGVHYAWWGADDSIWVRTSDDWQVYASPFQAPVPWDSGYGKEDSSSTYALHSLAVHVQGVASEEGHSRGVEEKRWAKDA